MLTGTEVNVDDVGVKLLRLRAGVAAAGTSICSTGACFGKTLKGSSRLLMNLSILDCADFPLSSLRALSIVLIFLQ